jgi:hypothetical protein
MSGYRVGTATRTQWLSEQYSYPDQSMVLGHHLNVWLLAEYFGLSCGRLLYSL